MAVRATGINPAMLRWAREQAGYSTVDSIAVRMKRPAAEIEAWESGTAFPTWRQLERLARNFYRRPTALFFLPSPPMEKTPYAEFDRLPKAAIEDLEPDTWFALRHAKARRMDLEELAQFDTSRERQILRDVNEQVDHINAVSLAAQVREYLQIQLDNQLDWPSERAALENWRSAIQDAGVWVFKRRFRQDDIAGFCLYDRSHPLIYLNSGQSVGRQMFSLFNELAHLLFKFNHLERRDVDIHLKSLEGRDREIEVACSKIATEVLIPTKHFLENAESESRSRTDELVFTSAARRYLVGKGVVLRKYLDQELIDLQQYAEKLNVWNEAESSESRNRGGGNFYAVQRGNLGAKFTNLAFRGYYQGAYGIDQLAEYLDIRPPSIINWENWLHESLAPQ